MSESFSEQRAQKRIELKESIINGLHDIALPMHRLADEMRAMGCTNRTWNEKANQLEEAAKMAEDLASDIVQGNTP